MSAAVMWTLLVIFFFFTDWSFQAPPCGPNQYLDQQSQCLNCTSADDTRCQPPQNESECIAGLEFFNVATHRCQECKQCTEVTHRVDELCSGTQDTTCIPTCPNEILTYDVNEQMCVLDCHRCPITGRCVVGDRRRCQCGCERSDINDLYCTRSCGTAMPSEAEVLPTLPSTGPNMLPNWGIGLIAIGVVIGIVAFSACFLLMGFCTSSKRGSTDVGSEGSNNSESILVSGKSSSLVTQSPYISSTSPFLSNHSTLDLLRYSPNGMHSSLSSVKGSPRSVRAMPTLSRTENTATPVWPTIFPTNRYAPIYFFVFAVVSC